MAIWNEVNLSEFSYGFRIDSEFYQQKFTQKDRILNALTIYSLEKLAKITDGEHGSVRFVSNGIKYLTAENIKNGYVDIDKIRYVDSTVNARNARARVRVHDILVSIKGTLGQIAIAEDWLLPANMNRDVAIIKPTTNIFNSIFISVFLLSKYGLYQLAREGSGAVQQMITLGRLRKIKIPYISSKKQEEISACFLKGLQKKELAKSLYTQAQQMLEAELGLDKLEFEKPISYETSFSEVIGFKRGDAEFFNPELRYFYSELEKKWTLERIIKYGSVIKFGNPDYAEFGTPIITQKHLSNITPADYGVDPIADEHWVKKYPDAILRQYDLLFYSVGAYLGKTNIWLNQDKAVPASFITLIRCHNDYDAGYLMVLLNTRFGIQQSKVFQSGTSQQYIYPKDIRKFRIPKVEKKIKAALLQLLLDSHQASIKSKQLLEQAKRRVEELIAEAVEK